MRFIVDECQSEHTKWAVESILWMEVYQGLVGGELLRF